MPQQRVRTNVTQTKAFETISITTAVGFTVATIPEGCVRAECTLEGADIRYRTDGTNPTAAVGHIRHPGDFVVEGENDILGFRAIAVSGTATLTVSYKKEA